VTDRRKPSWREGLDVAASSILLVAASVVLWKAWPRASEPREVPKLPIEFAGDQIKGDLQARIGMVQYSDFQCPFCGQFARETLPLLDQQYIQPGQLRFAFRHLPIERIHPLAKGAAQAAECAGRQGLFWQAHDAFFVQAAKLDRGSLLASMEEMGADMGRWKECVDSPQTGEVLAAHLTEARTLRISGTPYFLIGTVEGNRLRVRSVVSGAVSFARLKADVDSALASVR